MLGVSLTVIVCAVTIVAEADGQVSVRSCELYSEARPIGDLQPCLFRPTRDRLGREVLARAGRQLQPAEAAETTCRVLTGGGAPTG